MKLVLATLERHGGKFVPFAFESSLVSLGIDAPGNEKAMLTLAGQASYLTGRVLVRGSWQVELSDVCSRCLEQTSYRLGEQFSEVFVRRKGTTAPAEDGDDESPEEEVLLFSGEMLDLTEYISQSFLMSQPLKILCRDDCLGLCPICGGDRNQQECNCREDKIDPRLEILKGFKKE